MSDSKIHQKYTAVFEKAYGKLNPAQKQAVDLVEGPVMVIAGPGTGKTQILAVRIGRILETSDAQAHNILCLTYTDAATVAMRKRLVEIIGPEGHKVHIYTFHSFCNQVIQENLGHFGNYRQLDRLSDLEKVDVYDEIIDALPLDNVLKRLKGDPRFEARRMDNLFQLMKKENLDSTTIEQKVEEYLTERKENGDFDYKRKYKEFNKGDLNQNKWSTEVKKYEALIAGAKEFNNYDAILGRLGRYDYQDMILWVIKAFKNNPDLLAQYQERYHYFLIDEYQDTNGAQNELLELLISFWEENPNAFVVGDDDQAIYKFQGANLNNITDFKKKYEPQTVVLTENYRSVPSILDTASALIRNNSERIVNDPNSNLVKDLTASGPNKSSASKPIIKSYDNIIHESADIAYRLKKMHEDGINLNTVAIIYRNHRQVEKLVTVLEKKGVPLNIKRRLDIIKNPLIDNLLNILYYIQSEYDKPNSEKIRLFELLHYNFFQIPARDIAKIAIFLRSQEEHKYNWRDVISDKALLEEIGVSEQEAILSVNLKLDKWIADIANVTIQQLIENILKEAGILQSILQHPDKTWQLQVVNTFFDRIKQESSKDHKIALKDFLAMIDKMKETKIELGINKVAYSEKGVNFITAHSAKGLEFNHVFIIGCTKNVWDNSRGNNTKYSYPSNVNEDVNTNVEDERRLFFVAMTRAETQLEMSYSHQKEDGKALGAASFIDEIIADTNLTATHQNVELDVINDFMFMQLEKQNKKVELIDNDQIDKVLSRYTLSVTGLNKYLKCPISFYFQDILRVASARTAYSGFGKAVHFALQLFFEETSAKRPTSFEQLINDFKKSMESYRSHFTEKEFINFSAHGVKVLEPYYHEYLVNPPKAVQFKTEHVVDKAEYKSIPIKGVIDRIDIYKDYIEVVDYKTGGPDKAGPKLSVPSDKNLEGGDYWRQIVFYKLLLDSDRKYAWNMVAGYMDFIEVSKRSNKFVNRKFVVSQESIDHVGKQIVETWNSIQNHEFNTLCDDEKCYWCDFVRNDYVFNSDFYDEMTESNDIYEEETFEDESVPTI